MCKMKNVITMSIAILAKNHALQLVQDLHGYELEIQQQVVGKFFRHEIMKPLLPSFMSNLGETE